LSEFETEAIVKLSHQYQKIAEEILVKITCDSAVKLITNSPSTSKYIPKHREPHSITYPFYRKHKAVISNKISFSFINVKT